jgi:hypothetical protein
VRFKSQSSAPAESSTSFPRCRGLESGRFFHISGEQLPRFFRGFRPVLRGFKISQGDGRKGCLTATLAPLQSTSRWLKQEERDGSSSRDEGHSKRGFACLGHVRWRSLIRLLPVEDRGSFSAVSCLVRGTKSALMEVCVERGRCAPEAPWK